MKRVFLLSLVIFFAVIQIGWAGENNTSDASTCAVDNIINYYASMAKLKNLNSSENDEYKDRLLFLKKNKALIIAKVAQADTAHNLGYAHQICESEYKNANKHLGYSRAMTSRVQEPAYFDSQTGHRYIRQDYNTYAEFAKNGGFIKMVPSTHSLLNHCKSVYPITSVSYILYEKYSNGQPAYKSLPGGAPHPKGWKAKKLLISLK